MDIYFQASQNYLVPGENSSNVDMPGFQITIKKVYATNLSNLTIGSETDSNDTISYGFTFPDAKDVLNESMQQTIVLLNVCHEVMTFFFYYFQIINFTVIK